MEKILRVVVTVASSSGENSVTCAPQSGSVDRMVQALVDCPPLFCTYGGISYANLEIYQLSLGRCLGFQGEIWNQNPKSNSENGFVKHR